MSYSVTKNSEDTVEGSTDFKNHNCEGSKLKQKESDPSEGCPDGYLYEDGSFCMYYDGEGKFFSNILAKRGDNAMVSWEVKYVTYNGVKIYPDILTVVKRGVKDILNCYGYGYELLMDDHRV